VQPFDFLADAGKIGGHLGDQVKNLLDPLGGALGVQHIEVALGQALNLVFQPGFSASRVASREVTSGSVSATSWTSIFWMVASRDSVTVRRGSWSSSTNCMAAIAPGDSSKVSSRDSVLGRRIRISARRQSAT